MLTVKLVMTLLYLGDVIPFTAEELAKLNNTINYEIVCDEGERVTRAFVKDGKLIE